MQQLFDRTICSSTFVSFCRRGIHISLGERENQVFVSGTSENVARTEPSATTRSLYSKIGMEGYPKFLTSKKKVTGWISQRARLPANIGTQPRAPFREP